LMVSSRVNKSRIARANLSSLTVTSVSPGRSIWIEVLQVISKTGGRVLLLCLLCTEAG
jgi:hypothetical protein